ncbi:hypothetical protein JW887_02780 [Candidatus Dojkabacteria bacterium]|nr:hypothetical protein [Candidatus Dojkabacteria bacterium]
MDKNINNASVAPITNVGGNNQTPMPTPTAPNNQVPNTSSNTVQNANNQESKDDSKDYQADWRRTKCTNCGYVHEGMTIMKVCPSCGNTDPDKFVEAD